MYSKYGNGAILIVLPSNTYNLPLSTAKLIIYSLIGYILCSDTNRPIKTSLALDGF